MIAPGQLTSTLFPELTGYRQYFDRNYRVVIIGLGKMGLLHSAIINLLKPASVKAIVDEIDFLFLGHQDSYKILDFIPISIRC